MNKISKIVFVLCHLSHGGFLPHVYPSFVCVCGPSWVLATWGLMIHIHDYSQLMQMSSTLISLYRKVIQQNEISQNRIPNIKEVVDMIIIANIMQITHTPVQKYGKLLQVTEYPSLLNRENFKKYQESIRRLIAENLGKSLDGFKWPTYDILQYITVKPRNMEQLTSIINTFFRILWTSSSLEIKNVNNIGEHLQRFLQPKVGRCIIARALCNGYFERRNEKQRGASYVRVLCNIFNLNCHQLRVLKADAVSRSLR